MLLRAGVKDCSSARDRDLFQATIVAVELRIGRYADASGSARQLAGNAPAAARVVQLHAFSANGDQPEAAEVRAWLMTHATLSRIRRTVEMIDSLYVVQPGANLAEAEQRVISEEFNLLLAA